MLSHPFRAVRGRSRIVAFAVLLLANLVLGAKAEGGLAWHRLPSIVSLELAGNAERAAAVIDIWSQHNAGGQHADYPAVARARRSVQWDYGYLLAYSALIGLACVSVAERLQARGASPALANAGIAIAWLQGVAAALDAVENVGLLRMLGGDLDSPWPALARGCAVPKFALVAVGIVYAALGYAAARWGLGRRGG